MNQEFLADWHMTALVEQAKEHLGPLTDGRKNCLAVTGILGGTSDVSNIKSVPLDELIRVAGEIGQQTLDLPDGTRIDLKILD